MHGSSCICTPNMHGSSCICTLLVLAALAWSGGILHAYNILFMRTLFSVKLKPVTPCFPLTLSHFISSILGCDQFHFLFGNQHMLISTLPGIPWSLHSCVGFRLKLARMGCHSRYMSHGKALPSSLGESRAARDSLLHTRGKNHYR